MALTPAPPGSRFARTAHVARKELAQSIARGVFAAMAAAMVLPLLLIVGYLVWLAWPSLHPSGTASGPVTGVFVDADKTSP